MAKRASDDLLTEDINHASFDIDLKPTLEILQLINAEDAKVATAVKEELPKVARAVDLIVERLSRGGRLLYVGAGSSGRLGVLDAVECGPTFGTPPDLVSGVIAGGCRALRRAMEELEDDSSLGSKDMRKEGVTASDVVVGLSVSGSTPYVLGALAQAKELGAVTIGVSCNCPSPLAGLADVIIAPLVGPEVIAGSTRMKAATAQKMVLNMLSTASMIRLGKTYGNLMVGLKARNQKLRIRARRIVQIATGVSGEEAETYLCMAKHQIKVALVMILAGVGVTEAKARLKRAGGFIRLAIADRNSC